MGYPLDLCDVTLFSQTPIYTSAYTNKLYKLLALRDCIFLLVPVGLTVFGGREIGPGRVPELLCGGAVQLRATASLLRLWVQGKQPWALADLCGCVSSDTMASADF